MEKKEKNKQTLFSQLSRAFSSMVITRVFFLCVDYVSFSDWFVVNVTYEASMWTASYGKQKKQIKMNWNEF